MKPSLLKDFILQQIAQPEGLADDTAFNQLALEVYRHQLRHNGVYRQFCEAVAPGEVKHWKAIPPVPTSAFRHAELRTFPAESAVATFHTSGTTGEGFGRHFFATTAVYEASILAAWERLALPALPQLSLIPTPEMNRHSSLSWMMGALARQMPQTQGLTPGGQLDLPAIEAAVAQGPILVLGTALAFLNLFERLGSKRLPLAPGSLALETGGYKGSGRSLTKEALYAQFHAVLGLPAEAILNEYSMTELSSQWYTRGLGGVHTGPPWTRFCVIDPVSGEEAAPGQVGILRLFDPANLDSVLAIQTQDLAIAEGNGFQLLGRDPNAIPRGCSRAADELLRRE